MSTLTITTKGQVTLRRNLLEHLGVAPGDKVTVEMLPDGRTEVRAAVPAGDICDVFNQLKRADRPILTIEQMNAISARGWAGGEA